jgi:hypothetical protein
MRTVVIYPGRFHPFHRGHKASYDYLTKRYGTDNVFVVSSDKQDPETSPFSFADKMSMMTKLGIPPGHIAQVKNPYQAQEIRSEIDDPENTVLIFAVSEKDMSGDDARFSFGAKKDGSPSYMQPMPENGKGMKPMTQHAYVAVTPTVNFRVRGVDANSASQIRKQYIAGNDADRDQIIADLYGDMDAGIRDIFDRKLGTAQPVKMVSESRARIQQKINYLKETINQLKNAPLPGNLASQLVQLSAEQRKFLTQYIAQLTSLEQQIQQAQQQSQISKDLINTIMALSPEQKQSVVYLIAPTWQDRLQQKELDRQQWHAKRADKKTISEEPQDYIEEKWSTKYKRSINCANPRGFSQKAHCAGRKK